MGKSFISVCDYLDLDSPLDFDFNEIKESYIYCTKTEEGLNLTWQINGLDLGKGKGFLIIGKYAHYHNTLNRYIQLETMISHMPCNVYWMDRDLTHIGPGTNDRVNFDKTRQWKRKVKPYKTMYCLYFRLQKGQLF